MSGRQVEMDLMIRQCIREFSHPNLPLLKQVITSLAKTAPVSYVQSLFTPYLAIRNPLSGYSPEVCPRPRLPSHSHASGYPPLPTQVILPLAHAPGYPPLPTPQATRLPSPAHTPTPEMWTSATVPHVVCTSRDDGYYMLSIQGDQPSAYTLIISLILGDKE